MKLSPLILERSKINVEILSKKNSKSSRFSLTFLAALAMYSFIMEKGDISNMHTFIMLLFKCEKMHKLEKNAQNAQTSILGNAANACI